MAGYAVYAAFSLFHWQRMNVCLLMLQHQKCLREGPNHMVFTVLELRDPQNVCGTSLKSLGNDLPAGPSETT